MLRIEYKNIRNMTEGSCIHDLYNYRQALEHRRITIIYFSMLLLLIKFLISFNY